MALGALKRQLDECLPNILQLARDEVAELDKDLKEMEELRKELACYFCEDETTFKLEECIKNFNTFCEKFKKAIHENKERKTQEEKAEQRRRQREEQEAKKRLSGRQLIYVTDFNVKNKW